MMTEEEDPELTKAVNELMAIPLEERTKYCIDMINALADTLETAMNIQPKLKQAKVAKDLMKEIQRKRYELLPIMYYIIKPEFRETVRELLDRFAKKEVEQKLVAEKNKQA